MEMFVPMRKRLQDEVGQWVDAELQVNIIMNLADMYAEATRRMCGRSESAGETSKGRTPVTSAEVPFVWPNKVGSL